MNFDFETYSIIVGWVFDGASLVVRQLNRPRRYVLSLLLLLVTSLLKYVKQHLQLSSSNYSHEVSYALLNH